MKLNIKYIKNLDLTKHPFFIAEIGFNFSGDITLAKEMISAAKESGADAVKFQSFTADTLLLKSSGAYNIIKENELSQDKHFILNEYCDSLKIDFFSTPFNIEILNFLIKKLKVKLIKIASGDMNYLLLLEAAALSKLPVILSTGFSDFTEISQAVNFIKKINDKLIIMHCIGNYPLEPQNANLLVIPELIKRYKCITGFSDHSLGGHLCCAAAALGARVFEKHFTISRKLGTIDNPISTEPYEFKKMTDDIRDIISGLGDGLKNNNSLSCEEAIKKLARRGIYASKEIKKGEKLSLKNIKIVRPFAGNISPFNIKKILGKLSKKNYNPEDSIIL